MMSVVHATRPQLLRRVADEFEAFVDAVFAGRQEALECMLDDHHLMPSAWTSNELDRQTTFCSDALFLQTVVESFRPRLTVPVGPVSPPGLDATRGAEDGREVADFFAALLTGERPHPAAGEMLVFSPSELAPCAASFTRRWPNTELASVTARLGASLFERGYRLVLPVDSFVPYETAADALEAGTFDALFPAASSMLGDNQQARTENVEVLAGLLESDTLAAGLRRVAAEHRAADETVLIVHGCDRFGRSYCW
jgi:hypothetical protein